MISESKYVGAILNVLMLKKYVYALVGVLIKWLYDEDGLRIEICWSDFKCFNVKKICICISWCAN